MDRYLFFKRNLLWNTYIDNYHQGNPSHHSYRCSRNLLLYRIHHEDKENFYTIRYEILKSNQMWRRLCELRLWFHKGSTFHPIRYTMLSIPKFCHRAEYPLTRFQIQGIFDAWMGNATRSIPQTVSLREISYENITFHYLKRIPKGCYCD